MAESASEKYLAIYEDLLGFVPPRTKTRIDMGLELDRETLERVEEMRQRVMYPKSLDTKTSQMILFAVLLSNLTAESARIHAIAAKRAGATKEELHAVAGLAFLFSGFGALNSGCEIIDDIFDEEKVYT